MTRPSVVFLSNTGFEVNYRKATERLRPQDHPAITEIRAYDVGFWDIEFRTNSWDWLSVNGNFGWGHQTNFNPVEGKQPETGDWMWLNTSIGFRLNPWTAVYAGVNSNAQNLELVDTPGVGRELQRTGRLRGDARQFFVKVSYLERT